jgi:rhodanese-related sulfurtransferase
MSQLGQILEQAHLLGEAQGLPYSGAVTPQDAWALAQGLPHACIVDVRTHAEWQFVGIVPGATQIEWQHYPLMDRNPDFLTQLRNSVDPQAVLLFLCRSGVRSHAAAELAAAHGYSECFNILYGFEGDKDENQQRGRLNGWKAAGLPWSQ